MNITEYLAAQGEPLSTIGKAMHAIIDAALPEANAAMWHGHPVWSRGEKPGKDPICLLKAYTSYVTFGFWRGQELTDPTGRLTAGARAMASVKLRSLDDIDEAQFTAWLKQAATLPAA